MSENLAQKLISSRLIDGRMSPGEEIALRIDQTLTQDATGTLVMLEFEATGLPRVKTELSAQYVDHNLLQLDYKNPDDHLFLRSACQKFGVYYSPPGNGVSHPVHMERFGVPGKSLIGSDSHTPAAGALAMLSFGAGGLEVAMAMAGEPFYLKTPKIVGVRLTGRLPDWVSAKDVILEMLRRYDVDGGRGRIFEYYGPGLDNLTVMDRHVIANMGTEMGATTSVFPSDERVREFLKQQGRPDDFQELSADANARYDETTEVNLSELEPLIARPSSPGNVVPVREEAGNEIYQAYIGSSANPGLRDFALPALMVQDRAVHDRVSFDINPSSRRVLAGMIQRGYLESLVAAGARIHQAGCNGCIGMGQAPATGRNSLRTVPRNFPGRSGVREDRVFLCSPETAAASALNGTIIDPRTLDQACPRFEEPERLNGDGRLFVRPREGGESIQLEKGPNIASFPKLSAMPDEFKGPLLLKMGDNVSTDEILPAGSNVLPFRSNIPEISKFCFQPLDETFYERAQRCENASIFLLGGDNYGQGSSREHAALAPRYLGVRVVIAKSFARIHRQNLVNFGILPLRLREPSDWEKLEQDDELVIENVREVVGRGRTVQAIDRSRDLAVELEHDLSRREIDIVKKGGLVNLEREYLASK